MKYTIIFALILLGICQAAPAPALPTIDEALVINSDFDISGQQVRQKRGSQDYFICYPSSMVYGSQGASHRRSSDSGSPRNSIYDSFDERKDRADRERAAYTASFGK